MDRRQQQDADVRLGRAAGEIGGNAAAIEIGGSDRHGVPFGDNADEARFRLLEILRGLVVIAQVYILVRIGQRHLRLGVAAA